MNPGLFPGSLVKLFFFNELASSAWRRRRRLLLSIGSKWLLHKLLNFTGCIRFARDSAQLAEYPQAPDG